MEVLSFDSEAGLFSIGSEDVESVKKFAIGFKALCDDESEMTDLFSRVNIKLNEVIPYTVSRFLFTGTSC